MDKKPMRPRDVSQLAKMMVDIASGETKPITETSSPSASYGSLGGIARAQNMTTSERQEAARKAAQKRWNKD
jgi:hypothetical protein